MYINNTSELPNFMTRPQIRSLTYIHNVSLYFLGEHNQGTVDVTWKNKYYLQYQLTLFLYFLNVYFVS